MASTMSSGSDALTASEWTQQSMFTDLMQQKWLLIGAGSLVGALWLWSRRSAPNEQAGRRLVRDWRRVDDANDARDLLGSNLLVIFRPALLAGLEQIEELVDDWFRRAEREINRL